MTITPLVPRKPSAAIRDQLVAMGKMDADAEHPAWGGYFWTPDGLHWTDPEEDDFRPLLLCGPFAVRAMVRSSEGENWGVELVWEDADQRVHRWVMPLSLTAGFGVEYRAVLVAGCLYVTGDRKGRQKLTEYLAAVRVSARARLADKPGWHDSTFLLPPDFCAGGGSEERVVFATMDSAANPFRIRGTLEQWQETVGRCCVGNSRLACCVAAAFAPPLLRVLNEDGFGLHLGGGSSTGKSTSLFAAGSVWGGGPEGYHLSWRTTSAGIEGVAQSRNDSLLVLDELGEVEAKDASEITYMLANNVGKQRAKDTGVPRKRHSWRLIYLSSGELGLEAKLTESGFKARAGQGVRLIEIPIESGSVWECTHDFQDGRDFADALRRHTAECYGTPIRAYLSLVVPHIEELLRGVRKIREDFVAAVSPPGADGQVRRVAAKFGLVAAAGELARVCGVLPWPEGESIRSARTCFDAWLAQRGTAGCMESLTGVREVLRFLDIHGPSRFEAHWEPGDTPFPVRNRAGYRRRTVSGAWEYLVFPSVMSTEVLKGLAIRPVLEELARLGILDKPRVGWAKQVSLSATEKPKFYCLRPSAIKEEVLP